MPIQRYEPHAYGSGPGIPCKDGSLVQWDDVEQFVTAFQPGGLIENIFAEIERAQSAGRCGNEIEAARVALARLREIGGCE